MHINRLDHLVLTVADLDASVRFYTEVLGDGVADLRTGAHGDLRSVYIRDPDDNLVELSNYVDD